METGIRLEPRLSEKQRIDRIMDSYGYLDVLEIERIERRKRGEEEVIVLCLKSKRKVYVRVS